MLAPLRFFSFQAPRSEALETLLNRSMGMQQLELSETSLTKPIQELCSWLNNVFCVDLENSSNPSEINRRLDRFVFPEINKDAVIEHSLDQSFRAEFKKEEKLVNLKQQSPDLGTPMRQVQEVRPQ